jgi:2-succinyl-6-hydroxy-2,4-cyclohexadiene-1-carboxylate synthase
VLHADVEGTGPRLVLVHGFTQTGRSWGPVGADLALHHEVVRVDAPGHGQSAAVAAGLPGAGHLVAEAGGAATYVGYSMGGRICLHTALERPDVVRRLVLIGATGGIDDAGERAARVQADEALAAGLERDGLDAFLERWLALPLFAGLSAEAADPAARRENTVAGLAASLRTAGTGTQAPLWDRLGAIEAPVLVVAGALDAKFSAAGRRLVAAIGPNATYAEVPGAGHTAHLEQPEAFLATLRAWLAATPA